MHIGAKVIVNVPDEKWCHRCHGVIVGGSTKSDLWMVELYDVAPIYLTNNPYEFREFELVDE